MKEFDDSLSSFSIAITFQYLGAYTSQKNLKPKIRIIGGDSAPEGRYPYAHVTLQMDDGHQCGGSLIAPDIILTAAHCRGWYDTVHVDRQNIIDALDTYEAFEAADVILHPQFEPVLYRYDFALVKMHQPVQNRNLQPIRLDDGSTFLKADDELTILGWGAITDHEQTNPAYPNVLQKGKVGYMQNDICEFTKVGDYFLYKDEIFPEMICAKSNDGVDACKGDSGGPLIKESSVPSQDVQVGLMSWGRGCGVYPGVYSRIASEYDWIRQNVCSASKDPPSYMNCQPDERSSYDVMGSIAWPASTVTVTTTESNEANDGNRRRASTAPDLSAGQSIIVAGHAILLPLILLAMLA